MFQSTLGTCVELDGQSSVGGLAVLPSVGGIATARKETSRRRTPGKKVDFWRRISR